MEEREESGSRARSRDIQRVCEMRRRNQTGTMTEATRVLVAAVLIAGCSAHYPDYDITSFPELKQATLEPRGKSVSEFTDMLMDAGATNIQVAHGIGTGGVVVDAVAADYLYHVYLFRDGEYLDRVKITCDPGRAAVHPMLKVVQNGDLSAVVLLADVMTVGEKRAGMLVQFDEEGVTQTTTLPVHGFIKKHGGMRDPYVGGTSLTQGLLVTARDDAGVPWTKIYVLKLVENKLSVDPVPYSRGFQCSCFNDWLDGQDGRTLFGDVIQP